jgi:mycothione reductase
VAEASDASTHYDLVVVGAGSGNTIVDSRFDSWKVAIVEPGPIGGTCLNRGCIPSKMLIHPADLALQARRGPAFGVRTSYDGADWPAIRDRVFSRTDGDARGGREYREGQDNVDLLVGTCAFTGGPGEKTLEVSLGDGSTTTITADQVVLAAGSRPVVPDIPGLHDVPHHTSDDVMRLETLPRRMAVIGGGYVGSELAHVLAEYGVQITQVDSSPRLLGTQDEEISEVFTAAVAERWDVRLETELERAEPGPSGAVLHLSDGSTVEVDAVLVAVGRTPNADTLGLDHVGVEVDDAGRVVVDQHQRTGVDGIWALGDLSSPEPLKHVANQDARVVQHNLLHPDDLVVSDHRFVPQAVFAQPQVASVGQTEAQAREAGIDLAVGRHDFADIAHGWALMEDDTGHLVKLLADRSTGLLVGAHLVGPQASVLVQPLIQAMSFGQPVADLARGQYWIHPALTEVVENALIAVAEDLHPG